MHKFNNSPALLISNTYPSREWLPWKFSHVPPDFWTDPNNRRKYITWLSSQLKIESMEDWYNVTNEEWTRLGKGLFSRYKNSPFSLLSAVYPDYEWLPWKFSVCPRNFWGDIRNQTKFMDWLKNILSIKDMEDWYSVLLVENINKNGGGGLVKIYKYSPLLILSSIYPDFEWLPWKFKYYPRAWNDLKYQKLFLDRISKQLNITHFDDWYTISAKQLIDFKGGFLLLQHGTLHQLLSTIYNNYHWSAFKFINTDNIWTHNNLAMYFVNSLVEKDMIQFVLTGLQQYVKTNKNNILLQLLKNLKNKK